MTRTATIDETPRIPIRTAVLELLARAAPRPAALGAPSAEEQEFLDTLRRIVARSNAEELWDRYRGTRSDPLGRIFARSPGLTCSSAAPADLRLGAGEQAADIGVVADEDQRRQREPEPDHLAVAGEHQPERGAGRGHQRGERGEAEGEGGGEPGGAGGEPCRPGERQGDAEEGGDALAAAEASARPGRDGRGTRRSPRPSPRSRRRSGVQAAPRPRPWRRRGRASRPRRALLPVRSTLVAPMLPEPIARRSPRPRARVMRTPNGIEPSR